MSDSFGLNKSTFFTIILCLVIDLLDFLTDAIEQGGQSVGLLSGVVEWLGDSSEIFLIVISLIILRARTSSQIVLLSAALDPIVDEGWCPSVTLAFIVSGLFGINSLTDKIKMPKFLKRG